MTREEVLEKLNRVRGQVREIREATESPAISACMREMEIQLHMAFSALGATDSVCPEAES